MKTSEKIAIKLKLERKKQTINNVIVGILTLLILIPISITDTYILQCICAFIGLAGIIELLIFNKKSINNKNYYLERFKIAEKEEYKIEIKNNNENNCSNKNINNSNVEKQCYTNKEFLTPIETKFYNILKENFKNYDIIPQINLATIIEKLDKNKYQNELFRNIDFGLIKDNKVYLLIEINDKTHNEKERQYRDIKVKAICKDANLKLITFYANMPNEEAYIINRISNEIKEEL